MKKENRPLVDVHSDFLMDVVEKKSSGRKSVIEEDWVPGMRRAGINLRVAAVYVDEKFVPDMALRRAMQLVSALLSEERESPSIRLCRSYADIEESQAEDKIGLILALEGVEPLLNDIRLLPVFHALGLRVMSLTHSRRNFAADGAPFFPEKAGTLGGLTEFGSRLVREAQDLGILIDVTHINDTGFWEVMDIIKGPVIATHSNCRSLCDHPRNFTDDMIKAVAERGGVIGLLHYCFGSLDGKNQTIAHYCDHLEHMVEVAGIEHVGFGFDFCEYLMQYLSQEEYDRLPVIITDKLAQNDLTKDEDIPRLIAGLKERGFKDEEIALIQGGNFLRLFKDVWS
ncbi:MAG: dipeptidase [Candidatus Aminicenantes bacterium]|nr:dipeptidase [Candidatus Aminicenantes bacterium]